MVSNKKAKSIQKNVFGFKLIKSAFLYPLRLDLFVEPLPVPVAGLVTGRVGVGRVTEGRVVGCGTAGRMAGRVFPPGDGLAEPEGLTLSFVGRCTEGVVGLVDGRATPGLSVEGVGKRLFTIRSG